MHVCMYGAHWCAPRTPSQFLRQSVVTRLPILTNGRQFMSFIKTRMTSVSIWTNFYKQSTSDPLSPSLLTEVCTNQLSLKLHRIGCPLAAVALPLAIVIRLVTSNANCPSTVNISEIRLSFNLSWSVWFLVAGFNCNSSSLNSSILRWPCRSDNKESARKVTRENLSTRSCELLVIS